MRRLFLKYRRGHGFDLYDRPPGEASRMIAERVGVTDLTAFLLYAANELGRWGGRTLQPARLVSSLLLPRKVA
jgi:hypothetical protein